MISYVYSISSRFYTIVITISTFFIQFSQFMMQLKTLPSFDVKLSYICIVTLSALTYIPPHYFRNDVTKFNLIDGGVATTNEVNYLLSKLTSI